VSTLEDASIQSTLWLCRYIARSSYAFQSTCNPAIYTPLGIALAAGTLLLPTTTSPRVVNVTPANALPPASVAAGATPGDVIAAALADTLPLAAPEANTPGAALGSLPSALATATGRDVRPGRISAA